MNLTETSLRNRAGVTLGERMRVGATAGAGGLRRVDEPRTMGPNAGPPKALSLGQAVCTR
jgi:hypothetical protein